jgi:hypothetical protein
LQWSQFLLLDEFKLLNKVDEVLERCVEMSFFAQRYNGSVGRRDNRLISHLRARFSEVKKCQELN